MFDFFLIYIVYVLILNEVDYVLDVLIDDILIYFFYVIYKVFDGGYLLKGCYSDYVIVFFVV